MNAIDTMKLSEFEKLLKSKDWRHISYTDTVDIYDDEIDDECGERQPITCVYGLGQVYSSNGNIVITYSEGYAFIAGDSETFETSIEGLDNPWYLCGVTLVDDDGDLIDFEWEALPSEFSCIDYESAKSVINSTNFK